MKDGISPFNGDYYASNGEIRNLLEIGEPIGRTPKDRMSPFNGDYYDSKGEVRSILEIGKPVGRTPKDGMSPFNGDFYASDGSVHNIDELNKDGVKLVNDLVKANDKVAVFYSPHKTLPDWHSYDVSDNTLIETSVKALDNAEYLIIGGEGLLSHECKHLVSLSDMCRQGRKYTDAMWDEKIGDSINYLLLLRAVVEDGKQY